MQEKKKKADPEINLKNQQHINQNMQFIDFEYRGKHVDIPGSVLKVPLKTTLFFF